MKLVKSKQIGVKFSYCPHPVTLDKSKEWGEGNIQNFPNGVFFKHNETIITHGVQPTGNVPVGWIKTNTYNLFDKAPIYVKDELLVQGERIEISTLDGNINYLVKSDSYLVFQQKDGKPDLKDSWVITKKELLKNYYYLNKQ